MANYYVSLAGSDDNDGLSQSTPWKTLTKLGSVIFDPGDSVFLRGGDNFPGSIAVQVTSQPGPSSLVTLMSYGAGRALILAGVAPGISIYDSGYVVVDGIDLQGAGIITSGTFPNKTASSTTDSPGLYLVNNSFSTPRVGIAFRNMEIQGFAFVMLAANTNSGDPTGGYIDLTLDRIKAHDCLEGIYIYGNYAFSTFGRINQNVRILNCQVYNTPSKTSSGSGGGFPILIFNSKNSLVENCVVSNAGDAQSLSSSNGVAGIMFARSDNCVIRRCESYDMWSPQNVDGNAFDFDENCVQCTCEYSYGHDVDGAAMMIWNDNGGANPSSGAVIRYNIFVNGGRGGQLGIGCCFRATPHTGAGNIIYNNVMYNDGAGDPQTRLILVESGSICDFYNNIFCIGGAIGYGTLLTNAVKGNVYNIIIPGNFIITINGITYITLAAMRTAGYEIESGHDVGAFGNPQFTDSGSTEVVMPASALDTFSAYDIGETSVAIGAGIDPVLFTSDVAPYDWHGNSISTGTFDSGVARFGSVAPPVPPIPPVSGIFVSYSNDSYQVSTFKLTHNFWAWANAGGYGGDEPKPSETAEALLRKAVSATQFLAD